MKMKNGYMPTKGVIKNSVKIAFVVGSVLNLVNQWDGIVGDGSLSFIHIGLNYFIPFCVATFGAVVNRSAPTDIDL